MADDFQLGSGSWWDSSRNRFDGGTTPSSSSIPTTLNSIASFGWPTEMVDMKNRSSMDSATVSTGGSMVLQGAHDDAAVLPNMQMMGLGLSSQMDWNQALLGEKTSETSFRSLLQEDFPAEGSAAATSSQDQWRQKLYSGGASSGFSLDQPPQFSPQASSNDSTITSQNIATAFQVDPYGGGMLLPENHSTGYHNRPMMNYSYPPSGYAPELVPKYPQFLKTSPPKQPPPSNHLHFTNNTPFWNASAPPPAMADSQTTFFPALQTQIPAAPFFDDKPKNKVEVREPGAPTKKPVSESSNKRARNETPPPLPAFKVRKEKMGDRITALQQLVSPFGKTDTASVLSEAIEYIKFLHEQVGALSAPYMKNGAPIHTHQQKSEKSKDGDAGSRQDLRSRGLCLVPVSSTFPVTHETAVDFWTPTFGGTFR